MSDLEQQEDDRENPHAECEREIDARIAERDAALAERDSAVSSLKLAYQLAKARDAKSSADVISKAVAGNCFANEVEAIKAERDAALAELADAKVDNVALWRVWVQSLGDEERKTLAALAAVPPRAVKGDQDDD